MKGAATPAKATPERASSDSGERGRSASGVPAPHGADVKPGTEQQPAFGDHELPEFVHQYLRDYIALADQKAAFVLAAVSAILAFLVSSGALQPLKDFALLGAGFSWSKLVGVLACGLLSTAAILAILVVVPRLNSDTKPCSGFIFWKAIIAFGRAEDYAAAVQGLTKKMAGVEVQRHCFVLAQVCDQKYGFLNWAIRIGAVAFVLTVVFLFMK
ncbi:MAG: hypothetical protein HZA90_20865 [Verrucomicrobia bacterium]|nr:hypothetical protein [Verrucomicrobiota bacterium]